MTSQDRPIQSAVPRAESIAQQLSDLSWQYRGLANFFLDQSPFAYSTSLEHAQQIHTVIQALKKTRNSDQPLHIYEIGAGMGIFLKRLAQLSESGSKLDRFYATELHQATVDELAQLFEGVSNVSCETLSLATPSFQPGQKPSVAIMNYVVDSLAHHHIEIRNANLYELRVETRIDESARVIDAGTCPPRCLDTSAIEELLKSNDDQRKARLAPQLTQVLTESLQEIPLDQSEMDREGKEFLISFAKTLPNDMACRFNFSSQAISGLRNILSENPDMLVVYDFGSPQVKADHKESHLKTQFGSVVCMAVYFPLLAHLAKEMNYRFHVSNFHDGHSQLAVFLKGDLPVSMDKELVQILEVEGGVVAESLMKRVVALPEDSFESKLQELFSAQDDVVLSHHTLLMTVALECQKRGVFDLAISVLNQVVSDYGPMAVSAYELLGEVYLEKKELEKAELEIKRGLSSLGTHPGLLNKMALISGQKGDAEQCIYFAKRCLKYSYREIIWGHYLTIALMLAQGKKGQEAKAILDFLVTIEDKVPSLVPSEISNKAKQFLTVIP